MIGRRMNDNVVKFLKHVLLRFPSDHNKLHTIMEGDLAKKRRDGADPCRTRTHNQIESKDFM